MMSSNLALILLFSPLSAVSGYTFAQPRRADPMQDVRGARVAVLGGGGYSGAVAFGFLQRATKQFGKGIDSVASIGATAESVNLLNRYLAKTFYTSADQTEIKLANLFDVEHIAEHLYGWDALVMGTDIGVAVRPVSPGTYMTGNDYACEVYWPAPKNLQGIPENAIELREVILRNVMEGARLAGVQHICLVDDAKDYEALRFLHYTGVPYTCLGPTAARMVDCPNYTFRKGVLEKLEAVNLRQQEAAPASKYLHREDLAALAIQTLMSLDWSYSRCLAVTGKGLPESDSWAKRSNTDLDNEWCVNSHLLVEALGMKAPVYVM